MDPALLSAIASLMAAMVAVIRLILDIRERQFRMSDDASVII